MAAASTRVDGLRSETPRDVAFRAVADSPTGALLMKIGEHRAKEVDDHHNYDAKCACMP